MKTVLFVPGYQEDATSREYQKTMDAIKAEGYAVRFVDIEWRRTTIDHWVAQLNDVYETYDAEQTILAGFSFGAFTAYAAALRRQPAQVWLFSLSPYFHEDMADPGHKPSWNKKIGHRRVDAFDRYAFIRSVKTLRCRTLFFYGDQELKSWSDISYRHNAVKGMKQVSTILIPDVGHDVTDPLYVDAISRAI